MLKRFNFLIVILFILTLNIVQSQNVSETLQNTFIWSGKNSEKGEYTVFRKTFDANNPGNAILNLFADARYILWINGTEVLRGPCRFDPKAPQYDLMDVSAHIKNGKNSIVVLIMAHGSNGKMMNHVPGLTLLLEMKAGNKSQFIKTDETWIWNNHTRYLPAIQTWGFVCDRIDARLDDGDWTSVNYDDTGWIKAKMIDGNQWGKLVARQIPLLKEWAVEARLFNGNGFPKIISPEKHIIIELERTIQGYATFGFEANEGDTLLFDFGYTADSTGITNKYRRPQNSYVAKAGYQQYTTTDSYGFRYVKISSRNNPVNLLHVKATDRRYPYVDAGNFVSNDTMLNQLWVRSAHTMRMNAEDGYMDCALREKTEWMGDAAVVQYPVTRVMFGYAGDGEAIRSDAGLMKSMLRHVAQSQTDSGTVKAHHPSDRWDKHGYIEDYSCLWIQSIRRVYDYTGDREFVKEVWEPVKGQLQWFLDNRSPETGLLDAREFVIFDNPLAYIYCEGATLNAFLYKALVDAAFLASIMADKAAEKLYSEAAQKLFVSYNSNLWIEEKGTYSAGIFEGKKIMPSAHAALLALNMGVVPDDRRNAVQEYLINNYNNSEYRTRIKDKGVLLDAAFDINTVVNGVNMPYTAFWLLEELFNAGQANLALDFIRKKWASDMEQQQTGTLSESFGGGDLCHSFGSSAAYSLLTKVLGVSIVLPIKDNLIQIKPQLGDLTQAKGSVVSEHGVVDVSWEFESGTIKFSANIPQGKTAIVILPLKRDKPKLIVNKKSKRYKIENGHVVFKLSGGNYSGTMH